MLGPMLRRLPYPAIAMRLRNATGWIGSMRGLVLGPNAIERHTSRRGRNEIDRPQSRWLLRSSHG